MANRPLSLIIGKVWPEPSATAAGRRTADVLQSLLAAGHEVHFATAATRPECLPELDRLGISEHVVRVNDSAFDQWVAALNPDVVIFDRFMIEEQFGWRVEKSCPNALRILDTVDLHCLRNAREEAVLKGKDFDLFNDVALRELASIYRSDLSLMISEFEMDLLRDDFSVPESQLAYWPLFLEQPQPGETFSEREHCILIGSFLHKPNLDAARWCVNEIWPHVRKAMPNVELHLYGSYGEQYSNQFHNPQRGIHFNGRAGDALETMSRYRLSLAPLRFGAGLKGKLFDGFATGTPSIATPIATEGITGDCEWGSVVTENSRAFADEIIRLYKDECAWKTAQRDASHIARERFERTTWMPRLPRLLSDYLVDFQLNRHRNFTGRMLRHHHNRSTEFMSRWIEAKQQLKD